MRTVTSSNRAASHQAKSTDAVAPLAMVRIMPAASGPPTTAPTARMASGYRGKNATLDWRFGA